MEQDGPPLGPSICTRGASKVTAVESVADTQTKTTAPSNGTGGSEVSDGEFGAMLATAGVDPTLIGASGASSMPASGGASVFGSLEELMAMLATISAETTLTDQQTIATSIANALTSVAAAGATLDTTDVAQLTAARGELDAIFEQTMAIFQSMSTEDPLIIQSYSIAAAISDTMGNAIDMALADPITGQAEIDSMIDLLSSLAPDFDAFATSATDPALIEIIRPALTAFEEIFMTQEEKIAALDAAETNPPAPDGTEEDDFGIAPEELIPGEEGTTDPAITEEGDFGTAFEDLMAGEDGTTDPVVTEEDDFGTAFEDLMAGEEGTTDPEDGVTAPAGGGLSPDSSTGGDPSAANQAKLEQRFIELYEMLMEKQISFKERIEPYKTDNQNAGKG
jgi:hypothetical protein